MITRRCRSYITFSLEKPLRQLIENREVYTIRRFIRKQGLAEIRKNKNGKPLGLATVSFVGFVKKENGSYIVFDLNGKTIAGLDKFVGKSGFDSVEEWINAYKNVNRGWKYYFSVGKLYHVQLVRLF